MCHTGTNLSSHLTALKQLGGQLVNMYINSVANGTLARQVLLSIQQRVKGKQDACRGVPSGSLRGASVTQEDAGQSLSVPCQCIALVGTVLAQSSLDCLNSTFSQPLLRGKSSLMTQWWTSLCRQSS